VRWFGAAVTRADLRRQRDEAINLRAAQYSEGDFGRYVKTLEKYL